MALPGGRQQPGETDYHTAVREVEEEVGLRLEGSGEEVLYLGRMSDRHINSYGNVKPLAVCPFIFLLTTPHPPVVRLDSKEVGAVVWTPLSYFTAPSVRFAYMVHPLVIQTRDRWQRRGGRRRVEVGYRVRRMDSSLSAPSLHTPSPSPSSTAGSGVAGLLSGKLPSLFNLPSVQFPALALPGEFETADGRHGVSLGDTIIYQTSATADHTSSTAAVPSASTPASSLLSTPVAPTSSLPLRSADATADSSHPPAPPSHDADGDGDSDDGLSSKMEHDIDVAPGTFILWGFTLLLVSDLLSQGLGVRSLAARIDEGKSERARMLLWLHTAIDAVERLGKGWREARDACMRLVGGGESAGQDDEHNNPHDEKRVMASLHRNLAAAANTGSAASERRMEGSSGVDAGSSRKSVATASAHTLPSKL